MSDTIGYSIVGGQFKGVQNSHETLFTGGMLVPEGTKSNIVYDKIKNDLFVKGTTIAAIKSHDGLKQALEGVFNITFEKGAHDAYLKMNNTVRSKFDNYLWWTYQEVFDFIPVAASNNNKHSSGANKPTNKEGSERVEDKDIQHNTIAQPSQPEVHIQLGAKGPAFILSVDSVNNLKLGPNSTQDDVLQALVKLTPSLISTNTSISAQLSNCTVEIRDLKEKISTVSEDKFQANSRLLEVNAELRLSKETISTLEKKIIDLQGLLQQKTDSNFTSLSNLVVSEATDLNEEISRAIKTVGGTIKTVGVNVERLVAIQGRNNAKDTRQVNKYQESVMAVTSKIHLFLSVRSNNRLKQVQTLHHETLTAEDGPINAHTTDSGDMESFWCKFDEAKIPEKSHDSDLAVFLLEVTKNQSEKPIKLRNLNKNTLVESVKLMSETISTTFSKPIMIAVLPAQVIDKEFAIEVETALKTTKCTIIDMNSILDRNNEVVTSMLSTEGRNRGLSVARTMAEVSCISLPSTYLNLLFRFLKGCLIPLHHLVPSVGACAIWVVASLTHSHKPRKTCLRRGLRRTLKKKRLRKPP